MSTTILILSIAALIATLGAIATGKVPLWVAVILLAILACLHAMPWK